MDVRGMFAVLLVLALVSFGAPYRSLVHDE